MLPTGGQEEAEEPGWPTGSSLASLMEPLRRKRAQGLGQQTRVGLEDLKRDLTGTCPLLVCKRVTDFQRFSIA